MTKILLQLIEVCGPHCYGYGYNSIYQISECYIFHITNPTIEQCKLPNYDDTENSRV